jgi:hypothetical protein
LVLAQPLSTATPASTAAAKVDVRFMIFSFLKNLLPA